MLPITPMKNLPSNRGSRDSRAREHIRQSRFMFFADLYFGKTVRVASWSSDRMLMIANLATYSGRFRTEQKCLAHQRRLFAYGGIGPIETSSEPEGPSLFIAQCLCRIDPRNSQGWNCCRDQNYSRKGQYNSNDCRSVIHAHSIEHAANGTQCSSTQNQAQAEPQRRCSYARRSDMEHGLTSSGTQSDAPEEK